MSGWLKSFFLALVITVFVAIVVIVLAVMMTSTGSHSDGIGTYAGGISQRFVNILLPCLFFLFVGLLFFVRRVRARRATFKKA